MNFNIQQTLTQSTQQQEVSQKSAWKIYRQEQAKNLATIQARIRDLTSKMNIDSENYNTAEFRHDLKVWKSKVRHIKAVLNQNT